MFLVYFSAISQVFIASVKSLHHHAELPFFLDILYIQWHAKILVKKYVFIQLDFRFYYFGDEYLSPCRVVILFDLTYTVVRRNIDYKANFKEKMLLYLVLYIQLNTKILYTKQIHNKFIHTSVT